MSTTIRPRGDLQGPQVGVDGEDINKLKATEDVGGCKETFGDEIWVVGVPIFGAVASP